MSAIVSIQGKDKKKNACVVQLFKDLGCELKLCKARVPETKGKGENSNKFVKWIIPYDYKLDNEEQIIKVIEVTITSQSNLQINTGTKMPPYKLFQKEKEYLKPLPSNILLESYIKEHSRQTVPSTLLVSYKGNKYSVPLGLIGKRVDIYPTGDSLYIYHNRLHIAKHTISQNSVNYNQKHYQDALSKSIKNKEVDIEKVAQENLKRLEKL